MSDALQRAHRITWRQALFESLDSLRLLGRRSLLALLGIAVGCSAVVALLNIGHNAANEAINSFKGMGTNMLVARFPAQAGSSRPAPTAFDSEALILAVPGIAHAAPLTLYSTSVRHADHISDPTVVGTTADLASVLGLQVAQGRFISIFDSQSTFAIVGARIAQELAIQPGDRLPIEGYLFEVVGILRSSPLNQLVSVAPDESIFIPIEGMRRLRPLPEINSIVARAHDTERLGDDASAMQSYLQSVVKGREVEVQIPQLLLDGLTRQANTFSYLLAGLGGIALLVGGVGVMNVMLMNVAERRREIGVRMALGARSSDIRNLFLFEAAALSIVGAFLGACVGLSSAYAFVKLSGWAFELSPVSLPLGIFSALLTGLFFGLHPALSAARLQPVQALRDD